MIRFSWIACLLLMVLFTRSSYGAWPFFAEDGLRPGTEEYYEARATDPPGSRQQYKFGKLWPPRPRPVGHPQLFVHKFHAAHYWPYPYNCQDRESVSSINQIQADNGWITATTLYDYHFNLETQELNSAGQKQLHWIMTNVPYNYRQVYVATSELPELTAARTTNVEREVARTAGADGPMPVLTSVSDPIGRPAAEVQSIFTNAQSNMPIPVIPYSSGDSGSGASSSSGG